MRHVGIILSLSITLIGCGKKEEAAPAPVAAPSKVSVESTSDAAPPPAPAVDAPPAAAGAATPPPEAPAQPVGAASVYDTGTPAQRAAAQKSRRNLAWINVFKSGGSAEKDKARKAVEALPPAERNEFVEMIKLYGIPYP